MINVEEVTMYKRTANNTVFARDTYGRYICFRIETDEAGQLGVRPLPSGITRLPPIYGRVDFNNTVRFNGRTRSQATLENVFNNGQGGYISTDWIPLPHARSDTRRTPNQGMTDAMLRLTGRNCSATEYVQFYCSQTNYLTLQEGDQFEWCHLLAHSMRGEDNPSNIVAALRGNNTEQLAIESALHMYRCEEQFVMNISARTQDLGIGRFLGNVIRYQVKCKRGGDQFVRYLDCLNAPTPSAIHYYGLLEDFAKWANNKLKKIADSDGIAVSGHTTMLIKEYMKVPRGR
ncbi:hypothetical protein ONV78_16970 [Hahella sp. CR1]|uniref:hypothetical protein n=1 Tax=Hahella sp. CR1 TaxID=2992807 RepID=UPI0024421E8E|nr:hypothetical protein [Hahella sp. CR1]MDG9669434.1 hypothetical protein [Hahella sp. CR1]